MFSCKLPAAGWLNLSQIRQIQFEDMPTRTTVVTWHNGDRQTFFGEDAVALIQGWEEAITLLAERSHYRLKNRR
ncbi:MAG: hypothetical protein RM338_22375 [Nostoc sp. DedQUE12a]|nr:hypothetical protein [Nostoc sp. DedQUE12a]